MNALLHFTAKLASISLSTVLEWEGIRDRRNNTRPECYNHYDKFKDKGTVKTETRYGDNSPVVTGTPC